MPVLSAEVILPGRGGKVSVKVKRTADLKPVGFEVEPANDPSNDPPRYMVAFYEETGGELRNEVDDIHETELEHDPASEAGTSFSAIVVVGHAVVARDRRRVRNGLSSMG